MSTITRNQTKELDHLFTGEHPLSVRFDEEGNPHIYKDGHELHQSTCGGSKEKGRYLCINLNNQNYLIHRLVGWWMVHNDPDLAHLKEEAWETHHIDHNRQNNSKYNLKVLTRSEHATLHSRENAMRRKFREVVERLNRAYEEVQSIKAELKKARGGR